MMQQIEVEGAEANSTIECSHMHRLSALFMRHTTNCILLIRVVFETSANCQSGEVARGDLLVTASPILRLHSKLQEGRMECDVR